MIDLHCHLLPGLDDGPPNMDAALALARATVAAGVAEVVATPHVSPRYPNRAAMIGLAARHLDRTLGAVGIPLRVHAGAEIALPMLADLDHDELAELRLGDGNHLLLEAPLEQGAGDALPLVAHARGMGFGVLLAHPERSPQFQRDPEALLRLAADGVLMSVTATSFTGAFGTPASRLSRWMLREGLIHNVCSDMHDVERRPPGVTAHGARATDVRRLLDPQMPWLTGRLPEAVIAGTRLPPMPRVAGVGDHSSSRWNRLRRWVGRP